jgi:hypothetical protein
MHRTNAARDCAFGQDGVTFMGRAGTGLSVLGQELPGAPAKMDDHKTYYDPRDLWPPLVRAGFRPRGIHCFGPEFGFATFAVCRVDPAGA